MSCHKRVPAKSGGAEDGAIGAGLLVGWSDSGTRPVFDVVTGVSSGALIAPFAFLGREHDSQLREIFTEYGRKDIFTYNVPSLLDVDDAPLARLIEKYVDDKFLREIAGERIKGRILLIGTTNLDTQRPVLWDMGRSHLALLRKLDIRCTGGAYRPLLHDRHFSAASSFQTAYPAAGAWNRAAGSPGSYSDCTRPRTSPVRL
jgi:hypothetical protein